MSTNNANKKDLIKTGYFTIIASRHLLTMYYLMALKPIQKRTMILGLLIILISSPLALVWWSQKHNDAEYNSLGMRIPTLTVSTLNGTQFSFNCQGKKYILIYFTVECSHCRNELSNIDLLYTRFKPQIDVYAISLSKLENTMILLSSKILPFPVFQGERTILGDSIKIREVPTMLFIDEQRILRHYYVGERTIEEDRKFFQEFSNEYFVLK